MRSKGFTGSTKAATAVTEPPGNTLVVKGQSPRRPPGDSPEAEGGVASQEIMQSYAARTVVDARRKPARKGGASQRNEDIPHSKDAYTSPRTGRGAGWANQGLNVKARLPLAGTGPTPVLRSGNNDSNPSI